MAVGPGRGSRRSVTVDPAGTLQGPSAGGAAFSNYSNGHIPNRVDCAKHGKLGRYCLRDFPVAPSSRRPIPGDVEDERGTENLGTCSDPQLLQTTRRIARLPEMDTRRTLEGDFHTAREGATPGGTPTVVIGNSSLSRKRRLTTTSVTSIGDDPTVIINLDDREHGHTPAPQHVNLEVLLKENERLRFELENAKSLQQVLESTMSGLRDQLVREKLTHVDDSGRLVSDDDRPQTAQPGPGTTTPDEDDADNEGEEEEEDDDEEVVVEEASVDLDRADHRKARLDLSNALEKLAASERLVSRLELALSTASASKEAIELENRDLHAALEAARTELEDSAAEKNQLREEVATLEGQVLATSHATTTGPTSKANETNDGSTFEASLEVEILRNELAACRQTIAANDRALDDAHSKIRQLEQTMDMQDARHLSYLEMEDELAGWKTIFKHLDPNPTPVVLLNHIRALESELERAQERAMLQQASPKSPSNQLENSVVSLEQENLQLHQRMKAIKAKLEEAETTNARLAQKLGSGAFNPDTTKVLHMKRNPFADSKLARMQVELDTLRGENQVLKSRRPGVPGSSPKGDIGEADASPDGVMDSLAAMATLQGKLNATEKKLAASEKSTKRLQQVFSQQIATFRESIPLLFGWNLDMTTDPNNKTERARFTLTPTGRGAPRKHRHGNLCFGLMVTDEGSKQLALVDTPLSKKHQKEVDTCISAMNSIPLFVANLTLDQVQKM